SRSPNPPAIVPALAESWEISPDGMQYTFKLKQGVTFHDGTPFNAEAVKFTYDRVVALDQYTAAGSAGGTPADAVARSDPAKIITPCQSHDQIGPYESADILDDYTIRMNLKSPFSP